MSAGHWIKVRDAKTGEVVAYVTWGEDETRSVKVRSPKDGAVLLTLTGVAGDAPACAAARRWSKRP